MSNLINTIKKMKGAYLIAEIGINHNGDIKIAKRLIDAAYACGWHCVKFQKRNPEVCVPDKQKSVIRTTPWGDMTYLEYKLKIEFGKEEYDIINQYCTEKPLPWTVSVWDIDSLNFIADYDVPFIKIPSSHITNNELMLETAKSNIPVIISTGMSTWDIIDDAVKILDDNSAEYAILHCNSTYPAPHSELNLNIIPKMKDRYNCIIGYSGHEHDLDPSVVAVSMGAEIIERHITLDHNMWGTDHKSSLEIHAMDLLNKRIADIYCMLGGSEKFITESEKKVMKKLRG